MHSVVEEIAMTNEVVMAVQALARERDEAQDEIANLKRAFAGWEEAVEVQEKLDAVDKYFQGQQSPIALLELLLVLYGPGPKPCHPKHTTTAGPGHECGLSLMTAYSAYVYWYCACHGQVGDTINSESILARIKT